jgi:hypothetical protein
MISDTLLRLPSLSSWNGSREELHDVLPVALILFLKIIRKFHTKTLDDWNHGCVQSRVAASIACGVSLKLVMDVSPFSTMYCFQGLVDRSETGMDLEGILNYIAGYETTVVRNISLVGCLYNHHALAIMFLDHVSHEKIVECNMVERAKSVCLFFSFNITQWLETYLQHYDSRTVGPAIGMLSIKCADFPCFNETTQKKLAPTSVYTLAFSMLSKLQALTSEYSQSPLHGNFVNVDAWQHTATKSRSIMVLKNNLGNDMSALFPNGNE